jgi:hypothetical protein
MVITQASLRLRTLARVTASRACAGMQAVIKSASSAEMSARFVDMVICSAGSRPPVFWPPPAAVS